MQYKLVFFTFLLHIFKLNRRFKFVFDFSNSVVIISYMQYEHEFHFNQNMLFILCIIGENNILCCSHYQRLEVETNSELSYTMILKLFILFFYILFINHILY